MLSDGTCGHVLLTSSSSQRPGRGRGWVHHTLSLAPPVFQPGGDEVSRRLVNCSHQPPGVHATWKNSNAGAHTHARVAVSEREMNTSVVCVMSIPFRLVSILADQLCCGLCANHVVANKTSTGATGVGARQVYRCTGTDPQFSANSNMVDRQDFSS